MRINQSLKEFQIGSVEGVGCPNDIMAHRYYYYTLTPWLVRADLETQKREKEKFFSFLESVVVRNAATVKVSVSIRPRPRFRSGYC